MRPPDPLLAVRPSRAVAVLDRPWHPEPGPDHDHDPEPGAAAVAIDPRLRARRIAVRREAGRRRRLRLLSLVGLVAVSASALVVTYSPGLAVQDITIEGNLGPARTAEVAAVLGVGIGDPLVWVDAGSARQRIADLPWVGDVSVRKQLPHGLVVEVRDRHPVAVVAGVDGGLRLVDADGVVLGPAGGGSGLLPLGGEAPVDEAGSRLDASWSPLVAVAATLPPSLRAQAVSVGAGEVGPEVVLSAGGVVRLRSAEDLAGKYLAVLAVLAEVPIDEVAVLDVGVADAPVLTRKPR